MQTSVSLAPAMGRVGQLADGGEYDAVAKVASVAIAVGCMVVRDADDLKAKLPTSAAEVASALLSGGVALHNHTLVTDPSTAVATIPALKEFAALRQGRVLVLVEEAVTQGDQAYVRYANGVADLTKVQKGAFRKSPDGVAQVSTLTPTAVNGAEYFVEVFNSDGDKIASGAYLADGSATATEICDGLRAALGTIPGVVKSGTSTLILTASVAGEGFSVLANANIAVAATTPNSQSAAKAPGCYFKSSAAAGSLASLEVHMGGK